MNVPCDNCGIEIYRRPSQSEPPNFCDKDCYAEYRKDRITVNCQNCHKDFETKPYRLRSETITCSTDCKYELERKKSIEVLVCCECEATFERKSWKIRYKNNFCSHKCYAKSKERENIKHHKKAAHRRWAENVKSKYSACVDCGTEDDLHAHHIVPVSENADLAFEQSNGIALCKSCHATRHPEIASLLRS